MNPNFNKGNGLIPVIVQHVNTLQVLMLGYMNNEAWIKTQKEKRVAFFSRTRNKLWTKGETSGNYLEVKHTQIDCDNDTLLILALPQGPTCHTGATSCFGIETPKGFIYQLEHIIHERIENPTPDSYTSQLHNRGINKVAQKVGEEAVELIIEAKDSQPERFQNEAADLLFHFLLLLKTKNTSLTDIEAILTKRSKKKKLI